MSFWQKISPSFIPPRSLARGELAAMRERILQGILLTFAALGFPAAIMGVLNAVGKTSVLPLIYMGLYGILLIITIFRGIPYTIRANALITAMYALAVSELLDNGSISEIRLFLLAYISLTAILLSWKSMVWSVCVSVATLIAGWLYTFGPVNPLALAGSNSGQATNWITNSIMFLMIAVIIAVPISTIINGLNANMKKQADLTKGLQDERDMLEDRIHERTRSMARQMVQLRTAAEISRAVSELSDPDTLLQRMADLIKDRFDLYYVGVFLLDQTRAYAVLRAGTGEPGKRMMQQGHQLAIGGSSMIGWSIANRKPRIALDVGAEAVRFNNPHLPLTRSELALPIIAHDTLLGAFTIQSEKPNAFDENDLTILESIADSLGIALENDRLFNETRRSLEEVRALNHEYLQQAWFETLNEHGDLTYHYEMPGQVESKPTKAIEVPLMLRDEVIGHLMLEVDRPALSEDERSFVENVTTQTAIALENARLLEETERRAMQEQKLNELANRFSRALSIDEILRAAAQELGQLPAVAEISVQLNPMASTSKPATGGPISSAAVKGGASSNGSANGNGKEHAS